MRLLICDHECQCAFVVTLTLVFSVYTVLIARRINFADRNTCPHLRAVTRTDVTRVCRCSFYGLEDTDHDVINRFLSSLIENALNDLRDSFCVDILEVSCGTALISIC